MWRAVLATTGTAGLHEFSAGVRVVDVTDPASLALAVEDDDDAPMVVASHVDDARAAAVASTFVVAHRPERLVCHVSSAQAPLAVLVGLGTALESTPDAGHGVAVWRALMAASWSAVVLRSVTALRDPNPPVLQHLRSWFPGSRFLVRLGDDPVSVRADRPAPALTGLVRGAGDLFVTDQGADDAVTRELTGTLAPAGVRPLVLPGSWASVFGPTEDLQLALLPADRRDLLAATGGPCDGCGLRAAGAVCDFCRTRTRRDDDLDQHDDRHPDRHSDRHPDQDGTAPTAPGSAAVEPADLFPTGGPA